MQMDKQLTKHQKEFFDANFYIHHIKLELSFY